MADAVLNPDCPPTFVRASAYSSEEIAVLGTPRGLVPHGAPAGEARPTAGISARDEVGLGPRARFRFQSSGPEREVDPPSNLTADPRTSRRAGAVRKSRRLQRTTVWLLASSVGAAAAAAGYWLGNPNLAGTDSADATHANSRASAPWTPAERTRLSPILAAETASRLEMGDLLRRLKSTRPTLSGITLLEARAATAARSYAEAELRLVRARNEATADVAEIAFLRASNFGLQRRFDDMRASLDDAIAADPTRAEFHFTRAEIDRRLGRPQDALESYARALERSRSGRNPSTDTIAFRRRLLLIENGRESEIDAREFETLLAMSSPPGDWLLTAAAVALQRRDAAEAARWLQRARTAMPWVQYLERLDDYFFRNHANRPELKGLFPSRLERARFHETSRPSFIDP